MAKKDKPVEPSYLTPDNVKSAEQLKPNFNWDRPIASPGRMAVDFEERVNFQRLHTWRLARTRAALAASQLGAVLLFDVNNIRYLTGTMIGEWARDKFSRYALLPGTGDPYVWDFGSAAKHHRMFAPWLHHDHCKAGMLGLRGSVGPKVGLFKKAAEEIKSILDEEGVGDMPIGVDIAELPMIFAL